MKASFRSLHFLPVLFLLALRAGAQQDVSAQLETIRAKYHLPGMVTMVIKGEKIIAQGQAGVREEGQAPLLTVGDGLNIGSCSKSMTAAIAGRLVDRGLIRWTTRIRDLFPEYQTFSSEFWNVTLEQLLAHRGAVEDGATWEGAHFPALEQQTGTIQQIRRWAVDQALTDPPAGPVGQYVYSNQGFTTAGAMLEIASGLSWETLAQQEIFTPLGMTSSRIGWTYDNTVPPSGPVGHTLADANSQPVPVTQYSPTFLMQYQAATAPAGFVVTPMRDWARFLSVHLGHAPGYLQPATLKTLEAPQGAEHYALGMFSVSRAWAAPGPTFTHDGEVFEESSTFWMSPSRDLAVMAFTNCRTTDATVTNALDEVASAMIGKFDTAAPSGPLLDPASSFHFSSPNLSVTPAARAVTLTVTRPWPGGSAATVGYTVAEEVQGASADFGGTGSGTLSFRVGQTSALLSIPILPRSAPAGSRTFQVQLTAPSGQNTIGAPSSVAVEVHDIPDVITATPSPAFGGAVGGAGSIAPGATVTLQATPSAGFKFVSWTEAGVSLGTSATLQFTATKNRQIVANFDLTDQTQFVAGDTSGAGVPGAGAVSGPPAGALLSGFGLPAIDDNGAMAARATLKAGRVPLSGIYQLAANGTPTLPAFTGSPAPDAAPALFSTFLDPVLSPGGSVAFLAHLSGTGIRAGVNDLGLWTDAFTGLHLVLRTGQQVPGLPAGTLLKAVQSISLLNGELAAVVQFVPVRGLITAANDTALIRITGLQTVSVALRKGDGLGGSTVVSFSSLLPSASSPGQGRWHTTQHLTANARLASGATALVQIAPNGSPTVRLLTGASPAASSTVAAFGLPDGAAGALAVTSTLRAAAGQPAAAHGPGLLAANDATATLALDAGGSAAGSDYTVISDPVANASGKLAFLGTLKNTVAGRAVLSSGLFVGSLGTAPALSAGYGLPAADRFEHTSATLLWSGITSFVLPDGATAGPIFLGRLKGTGVTGANATGLWGMTSTGEWLLLLRGGEQIQLGANTKTVASFSLFTGLPGSFGARRSYNGKGEVALVANFTDRTQTLLRLAIP